MFHEIDDFHVVKNFAADVMHDFPDGICRYDLGLIIYDIIYKFRYISLEELNRRIVNFDYKKSDHSKKPSTLKESEIKNKCLIMTAAEMVTLVRSLNLIIGDVVAPCLEWDLYLQLKNLLEMVMNPVVQTSTHKHLATTIEEYLRLHHKLYPNQLKPKHHLLLHYPRIMSKIGSLSKIRSIRFEATHRIGKVTAKTSSSRVNVCRTIALKYQLILNYRFLSKNVHTKYFLQVQQNHFFR